MTLEERIDRIVHASEIELAGEAYRGKYELGNMKSITNFILTKLRNNEGYKNHSIGNKIILSKRSAEKLATHYRSGAAYQKTIAHIPQIIENMQFLEEMPSEGDNTKYNKYSYYIIGVNIDGESHTILSTVGKMGNEIYYDQNVFDGTPKEVFAKAENAGDNSKYGRLTKILQENKKDSWNKNGISPPEPAIQSGFPTASTSKYTKKSSDVQLKA
ncbi:MAG: hypothetical protein LBC87_01795 [Fibromonadaceae bacterium]|nr:hypothetical protein [Fibromonadaceae bacterium]